MKITCNKGFTLVEMSIAMLIVAFLTGSILVGKELFYAAEIRATIQQIKTFDIAYNTFQLKYDCLAGDCSNAAQLGFTGDFTIQLSKTDPDPEPDLLQYLNPISTAYAIAVRELGVNVNASLASHPPFSEGSVPLNGNGNNKIDMWPWAEGPVGIVELRQANIIENVEEGSRVYLKLTGAGSDVGDSSNTIFKPAFWVISSLEEGVDENGNPNIITGLGNGIYYQALGSFLPFAAATLRVSDTWNIDNKIDDGLPLKGEMRSTSTAQANLTLGPVYVRARDTVANQCLRLVGGNVEYNPTNPAAKCAPVIRARL